MTPTTNRATAELSWDPPGPGSWQLLADHYCRPLTATAQRVPRVWSESMTAVMTDLGLPLESATMHPVNGLPYLTFASGGGGSKPPPAWLLAVLARVLPSLRRSEKQLRALLRQRPWVEGTHAWYERDRQRAIDRLRELAAVDPDALDDGALAAHLDRCLEEWLSSARQHLELHAHDMFPPALFALFMTELGFTVDDALELLAGASPASTGGSVELDALREVTDGVSVSSFEELRALGPAASDALDEFLTVHGWRLVDGYDLDCVCLAEVPELVVKLVNAPPVTGATVERRERLEETRARVPVDERAEFDRSLQEARDAYGLRDDNGGILVSWPTGMLRRAMLAAGRRLAAAGTLDDPELVIEADAADVAAALRAERVLDAAELRERAAYRRSVTSADAPRLLGPPEPPMPEGLPGALGTVMRALAIMGVGEEERPDEDALRGRGIGDEPYEGRARLVTGAGAGLDTFEPGEVLVASMTSPTYNVVLAMAGAVVTEEGDAMSHAAIMARELVLPAVIGARGATEAIVDGDLLRVDPVEGTVTVVSR